MQWAPYLRAVHVSSQLLGGRVVKPAHALGRNWPTFLHSPRICEFGMAKYVFKLCIVTF